MVIQSLMKQIITVFWWQNPTSMGYLWLPVPGSLHCQYQHL